MISLIRVSKKETNKECGQTTCYDNRCIISRHARAMYTREREREIYEERARERERVRERSRVYMCVREPWPLETTRSATAGAKPARKQSSINL